MEQNKSGVGSIIGTVIIISLIILSGLYFWGKRIEESRMKQALVSDETQPLSQSQNEAAAIKSLHNADDPGSIQADLNATIFDNLNKKPNTKAQ